MRSISQELYSILDFFKSWKRSVYDSRPKGKPLVDLPSISTLNDLETTINGFGALFRIATECGAGLIPGRINQDGCESWFGHHRQAGGANRNMTGIIDNNSPYNALGAFKE